MIRTKTGLVWKLFAGVFMVMCLLNTSAIGAENASIVLIFKAPGDNTELRLTPPDLYIKKGTVVVWMNSINGEEVQVVFRDGKACKDVSFSPAYKGFSLDSKSCYVTSYIPYAATSSLQFTETGTFDYKVTNVTGRITGKGKVIVRDM